MKSSSSTRSIIAGALLVAAAIAFWVVAFSPKQSEAGKLGREVESLSAGLGTAQANLSQAESARRSFPAAYRQIVELGQAVPSTDETSSLLVELTTLAHESGALFTSLKLEDEEGAGEAAVGEGTTAVPASEVAASLMPLGASIGQAGLGVMPYTLEFKGGYFAISEFIGKLDSLVKTKKNSVGVDGRLVTINGFSLLPETEEGAGEGGSGLKSPILEASVSVTTYLTPPGGGTTAGAIPTEPALESATQTVAAE